MEKFGMRLKAARTAQKLTQEETANLLGYSKSAIRQYEQGQSRPSYERLVEMCRLFNVSSDYLLGLSDLQRCQPESTRGE